MKAKSKGAPKFLETRTASEMPIGCHHVKVKAIRYARTSSGEILHTKSGEIAMEAIFVNKLKQTTNLTMWTTEHGLWVVKELCRVVGINYNAYIKIPVQQLIGKDLYVCVAGVYDSYNGAPVDKITRTLVLPEKMSPYYAGLPPEYNGDPLRGKNPHGSMFAIYNEKKSLSPTVTQSELFNL